MLALFGTALAVPVFTADRPEDVEVATAAWAAAEACSGRTPMAAAEVPIYRDLVDPEGPDGAADTTISAGLVELHLRPEADNAVLAHEVSHAWIHGADAWMVEGRAELLALCVAERIPDHVRFRHWGGQPPLPDDIRTWTSAVDSFDELSSAEVEAYYVNSQRLFEAIGLVIPPERFWADLDSTEALYEELRARDGGLLVLEALFDVRSQRAALGDPDRDGLTTLYETLGGTDPYSWDTDGDGWWDGSTGYPDHAIVIPRDGSVVCSPWRPPGAERIDLHGGGNLHGHDTAGERWPDSTLKRGVRMSPNHAEHPGGMWFAVESDGVEDLVPNPLCRVHERYTLRDLTGGLAEPLAEFDTHLLEFFDLLEEDFGAAPRRAGIELRDRYSHLARFGDMKGTVTVEVPASVIRSAGELEQLDFLAANIAAAFRFGFEPALTDMAASAAFAWITTRTPVVGEPYVAAERELIRDYVKRARRCDDGWIGLAEWRC